MMLAPVGAFACLLVAYPVAYYLAVKANPKYRLMLVSLVVVPFWTSLLVRTYAWMYILGSRGIPQPARHDRHRGCRLLNTPGAVLLGIVYGYLPLMIMPIYVSLEKLDRRLLEASADLGAKPALDLLRHHPAPVAAGRDDRGGAGDHLAARRIPDPAAARRRQGVLHRQRAGRSLPAIAQLAVRLGHRVTLVSWSVIVLLVAMRIAWRVAGSPGGSRLMRALVTASICFSTRRSRWSCCSRSTPAAMPASSPAFRRSGTARRWQHVPDQALKNSLIIAFTSAGRWPRSSARWRRSAWSG
jgi:spermidine/putrescine transport system permease protein